MSCSQGCVLGINNIFIIINDFFWCLKGALSVELAKRLMKIEFYYTYYVIMILHVHLEQCYMLCQCMAGLKIVKRDFD